MPVVQKVSANNGDLQVLSRPPGQAQVEGHITRNIHRREAVNIAHHAVELNVARKVHHRTEAELVVRTAAFIGGIKRRVVVDLNLQVAVSCLQSPPIDYLPRRSKFDPVGFSGPFVAEDEAHGRCRGIDAPEIIVLIIKEGQIRRQPLVNFPTISQLVRNELLRFKSGIAVEFHVPRAERSVPHLVEHDVVFCARRRPHRARN